MPEPAPFPESVMRSLPSRTRHPQQCIEVVGLHLAGVNKSAYKFVVDPILCGTGVIGQEVPNHLESQICERYTVHNSSDNELASFRLTEVQY